MNPPFNIQPVLQNEKVILHPLGADDFDSLYGAAADPEIWEQHPNRDRWKKDVFRNYYNGAIESGGAFRIVDKTTGQTIGSTRFYEYNKKDSSIHIGYTFYTTACWGKGINRAVKAMMLDYIFQFVDRVIFHVGAGNIRSQIAITRLGAVKVAEQEVAYFGEPSRLNYVYGLTKTTWQSSATNASQHSTG